MSSLDPFAMVAKLPGKGPAPVHLWNPPFCGDIDMRIARDGTWYHEGRPIRRLPLVQLFASVLKKEGERYYLVTPHEKVGIQVEDCPFLIVTAEVSGAGREQLIQLTTNTGESFTVDAEHPLSNAAVSDDQPHPVVVVRSGLNALINRSVFYQLVELAESSTSAQGEDQYGLWSAGAFFPLN